jgi:hypothetical protein
VFIPVSTADFSCPCGYGRRSLFNREGRMILRCLHCESEMCWRTRESDYENPCRQLLRGRSEEGEIDEGR